MFLLIASFLAGVLTSLAPCVLPLLPVIIGSSVLTDGDKRQDRLKPFVIVASLAVSVIIFTILLKVSSVLIGIDPHVWLYLSGGIVILLGIGMFFPTLWARVSARVGLEHGSNKLLSKAYKKNGLGGAVLTGAALGPVFSSCSPVYALVLATVLPVNTALGIVYIVAYALGLGLAMLAIALAGRRFTSKLKWAVDPNGVFRKVLAVMLVLVGLLVISGYDKKFQTWAADHVPFGVANLEEKLIPTDMGHALTNAATNGAKTKYNVDPYDAPELQSIAGWINSNPTTLAQLKGKVVLIDFWTYSCINCQRTQPYLNKWYDKYKNDGFVILGLHAPEFAFEKVTANVEQAVKDDGIKYPVALDNDFGTWNAYHNQFWPAKYLIDKDGQVRYTQFGEGKYDQTEQVIQDLLKENGHAVTSKIDKDAGNQPVKAGQTPETYLGYSRGERFTNTDQFAADKPVSYTLASDPPEHMWSLGGTWQVGATQTIAMDDDAVLRVKLTAKEAYLVMSGPTDKPVTLQLNGQPVTADSNGGKDVDTSGQLHLDGARLYKLLKLPNFSRGQVLDVKVPKGTTINALTFGA